MVAEEVVLDAGKGDGEIHFAEFRRPPVRPADGDGIPFPLAPGRGGFRLDGPVGMGEAAVIGPHQVPALRLRNGGQESLPGIREQHARPVLVEPAQFPAGQQEDAPQHQSRDTLRMGGSVGEGEGRAPGSAEHGPALHTRLDPQALDILDQGPGGIVLETGVGTGEAATPLVEQRHPPAGRVEEPPHGGVDGPPRPAVQDDAGLPVRGPALLVIDLVPAVGGDPASGERLGLWIEGAAGGVG